MENLVNQSFPSLREERETGLEPAAPTLARSCSTNWATRAYVNCFVSVCQTHLISYYGKSNLSTIFWKNLTEILDAEIEMWVRIYGEKKEKQNENDTF